MQSKQRMPPVGMGKKAVIAMLFVTACAICASGIFFSVYSYVNNVRIQVLNAQLPGIVFGVAVLYLGVRYFISLMTLKTELYKPTSRFSWDNFKKKKK